MEIERLLITGGRLAALGVSDRAMDLKLTSLPAGRSKKFAAGSFGLPVHSKLWTLPGPATDTTLIFVN